MIEERAEHPSSLTEKNILGGNYLFKNININDLYSNVKRLNKINDTSEEKTDGLIFQPYHWYNLGVYLLRGTLIGTEQGLVAQHIDQARHTLGEGIDPADRRCGERNIRRAGHLEAPLDVGTSLFLVQGPQVKARRDPL